jgi:hypothetical protein
VVGRVAFPAVQGIVATIGMALAFGYTVVSACSGSCANLKKNNLSCYNFQMREHN